MTRFVDFYNANDILPVHQDKIEFSKFAENRLNLYLDLGIPISLLRDKSILEFGPGGGYNARLLLKQAPKKFTFVDASKLSLDLIPNVISEFKEANTTIQIIENLFLEFNTPEKFDYVIAEACIPGQDEPGRTLRHISQFVSLGGILSITTTSKSSHLAEMLRSLIALRIKLESDNQKWIVDECINIFDSHLATLPGKTRTIKDWVLDNLIQEIHLGKYDFNFAEAIHNLDNFVILGSSPRFYKNYRWYKQTFSVEERNKEVAQQLENLELILLDYRVNQNEIDFLKFDMKKILKLQKLIDEVYLYIRSSLLARNLNNIDVVFVLLQEISYLLPKELNFTKRSIEDFVDKRKFFNGTYSSPEYGEFKKWFGRGQQFFSFQKTRED